MSMSDTQFAPAPRGNRTIKYVIELTGPAGARDVISGYQYTDRLDPAQPEGTVAPGHARDSGRFNYDEVTSGYGRMTTIPAAFDTIIAAAGLAGWRPVRVRVLANDLHGTRQADKDVKTAGHLAAALENALEAAGVTIHQFGIPARLYVAGDPAAGDPADPLADTAEWAAGLIAEAGPDPDGDRLRDLLRSLAKTIGDYLG